MQIDRLLKIINILTAKDKVSAKELSKKFNVSAKTIYRDIDTLSIAGIPIVTTKGKNGGISILENYKISKSIVTDEEQNNVIMGLEILKALNYTDTANVLQKFENVFNKKQHNLIEIEFSYWGSNELLKEKFEIIKDALFNACKIKFFYTDAYNNKTKREVYPLKLVFKEKSWYLNAYCLNKSDYRVFNILRIENVECTSKKFNRDNYGAPSLKEDIKWKGDKTNVTLKFNSNCTSRVYSDFSPDKVERLKNGDMILKESVVIDSWFLNYLVTFGNDINIIEPKTLQLDIINYLEKKLKIFKKDL